MKLQLSALFALGLLSTTASAMSIEWGGQYRFEYFQLNSTSLGAPAEGKSYFLNSLQLSPKIIASDGFNVISRFDVLPNSTYANSQAGAFLGGGPSSAERSAVAGESQGPVDLRVSQLYLSVQQENAALVAGRAPIHFGLGITHNAGNGAFDHWGDTMDLVGYRFMIGNLSIMPIIGRPMDDGPSAGQYVSDQIWNIEYNNTETESIFAIFHQTRSAGFGANDGQGLYGSTAKTGGWKTQHVNFMLGRGWEKFKFKLEAGFNSGSTGLEKSGNEIKVNGYGIVTDMQFVRPESKWDISLRAGVVSGDNPDTDNFEGYALDRNFDVAMLMFNHRMGQADILGSGFQTPQTGCPSCSVIARKDSIDDETISNATFIAPSFNYKTSDRWIWKNTFVWAQLTEDTATPGDLQGKDLGFEWDTGFIYRPHERLQWINQVGLFSPGSAWSGTAAQDFKRKFTYGLESKLAITF
jgi:hypothetical protein